MPSRRPLSASLQQPLNPATGGPFGPSTSSCRSRSLDRTPKHRTPKHSAGRREMLHDPPPDKRPREVPLKYLGRIVRTRRNPASQTIIRRLSQCSSTAQSDAATANLRQRHFPVKSAETVIFVTGLRLTGELPDVGTDGVFRRNLIRDDGAAHPRAGPPSRRRHCRISPMLGPTLSR